MSTTEKDNGQHGRLDGTEGRASDDRMLDRNLSALLSEPPDPPRMNEQASERILVSLKQKVQRADAPAPALAAGVQSSAHEGAPSASPAADRPQVRGVFLPAGAVAATVAVLAVGGGLVGYYMGKQSEKLKRKDRVHAQREKEMREELAKLKKEQEHLRTINRNKDALLRRIQRASEEERQAIQAKLAELNKRAKRLADSISERRARRAKRAGKRGSAPLPMRGPAAAEKALEGL